MSSSAVLCTELNNVKVIHRKREGLGDHIAAFMVGVARTGFDIATRYPKHTKIFPKIKGAESNMVKVGIPKFEEQNEKASRKAKGKSVQSDEKDLPEEMELGEMRKRHLCFGPEAWLVRIVFLESIAGVPVSSLFHD
jgi:ubiquinol oxidase